MIYTIIYLSSIVIFFVNVYAEDGKLHKALKRDKIDMIAVKHLIENKASINSKRGFGDTPLHYACGNKNVTLEIIKYLIENKASVNASNVNKNKPLYVACQSPNISLEVLKCLIENNASLHTKNITGCHASFFLLKGGVLSDDNIISVIKSSVPYDNLMTLLLIIKGFNDRFKVNKSPLNDQQKTLIMILIPKPIISLIINYIFLQSPLIIIGREASNGNDLFFKDNHKHLLNVRWRTDPIGLLRELWRKKL